MLTDCEWRKVDSHLKGDVRREHLRYFQTRLLFSLGDDGAYSFRIVAREVQQIFDASEHRLTRVTCDERGVLCDCASVQERCEENEQLHYGGGRLVQVRATPF